MGYNSDSAADRLSAVRDMIQKVMSGAQTYYVGSRRVEYPSLSELRKLEKDLQAEVASQAGTQFSVLTMDNPA